MCRYEQGHRLPSLRTALELALILDVSIAALFGGIQHDVQKRIAERIAALRSELEHKHGAGRVSALASRQLRWLEDRLGPRRKFWEAEKYSMSIFDAAAIGLACFMRDATTDNDNDKALLTLPR